MILMYVMSLLLALYFVQYAVAPTLYLLPEALVTVRDLFNVLAVLNGILAACQYIKSKEKTMMASAVAGEVLSVMVIAVNQTAGVFLLLCIGLFLIPTRISPTAENMKRSMQLLTGVIFLMCNMSLLVNYTDWIKVEGLSYSLEASVVGELLLCIFAYWVLQEWDRLPQDVPTDKVRMVSFQAKLRTLGKYLFGTLVVGVMLCWLDNWLGIENLIRLFANDKWDSMKENLFVEVFFMALEDLKKMFA